MKKKKWSSRAADEESPNKYVDQSISIVFLAFIIIYLLQKTKIHEIDSIASLVTYKAPWIVLLVTLMIQMYSKIQKWRLMKFLSAIFPTLLILYISKMDKSILIHGHADKEAIYGQYIKIGMAISITYFLFKQMQKRKLKTDVRSNKAQNNRNAKLKKIIYYLYCFTWAIYLSTFLIIDERHPYMLNGINFMIVVHSVIQSLYGRIVYFDQLSQYGGYSILLRPIWSITDFSIFKLTLIFAILNLIFVVLMAYSIRRIIHSNLLGYLCFSTFIYTHYFAFGTWPFEKYYQVDPIRTIFPAIALTLVLRNMRFERELLTVGIVSGLALIWNAETGIFICGSYVVYLSMTQREHIFKVLLHYSTICFSVLLSVFGVCALITEESLQFEFLWRILNLYGADGKMSDLLFNKAWVIIFLFHALAMNIAANSQKQVKKVFEIDAKQSSFNVNERMIFLILLSFFLITYHLMRSGQHDSTLGNSGFLFASVLGYFLEGNWIKEKLIANKKSLIEKISTLNSNILNAISISILALGTFSLFSIQNGSVVKNEERIWKFNGSSRDELYDYEKSNGETFFVTINDRRNGFLSPYERRMNFAKKISRNELTKDLLILSPFDSMLYFHANAKSPVSWANWWHAWKDDFAEVFSKLENGQINTVLLEKSPGINVAPFDFHPDNFDERINEIITRDFTLSRKIVVSRTWYNDSWEDVFFELWLRKM